MEDDTRGEASGEHKQIADQRDSRDWRFGPVKRHIKGLVTNGGSGSAISIGVETCLPRRLAWAARAACDLTFPSNGQTQS